MQWADLNGDSSKDEVLLAARDDADLETRNTSFKKGSTLILIRDIDNQLAVARRDPRMICSGWYVGHKAGQRARTICQGEEPFIGQIIP